MPLSAVSVLVVAQSSSEIPEGLMNNSVYVYNSYYASFQRDKGKVTSYTSLRQGIRNLGH